MPLNTLTGSRVRERRLALGLRQAELARAAGISASYLNLIEHDRRRISAEVLLRLAQAMGIGSAELEAGAEAGLAEALRSAAGEPGGEAAELDRIEEFLGRYPGWAGLTAGLQTRVGQLERAVAALNDRLAHDPHLGEAMHEVLSTVSSVRSTAGILAQTEDLEPEWRQRFHANLYSDSERLAQGAEALVAWLEGSEQRATANGLLPDDELDSWLAARDWRLADLSDDDIADLGSEPVREAARRLAAEAREDARTMPEAEFGAALATGPDPVFLAARFGVSVLAAMRRLALWPGSDRGLVICDAAGALLFRRPVTGFRPPRFGAACALWPLFEALMRPGQCVETEVEMASTRAERFRIRAFCEISLPGGFGGTAVRKAAMLLEPLAPGGQQPALRIGASCRICPARGCAARRETSILGAA